MGLQTTQKETIQYIREEDFMNSGLSKSEREDIKFFHRKCKKFLKDEELVSEKVREFKDILDRCARGTDDYYADIMEFLQDEEMKENGFNMIDGYRKWKLNSPTLWEFMQKIYEVSQGSVNY